MAQYDYISAALPFSAQVTFTSDLFTSKLPYQLLLMCVTFHLRLRIVWFPVFESTVYAEYRDGQTDAWTDGRNLTRNVAL